MSEPTQADQYKAAELVGQWYPSTLDPMPPLHELQAIVAQALADEREAQGYNPPPSPLNVEMPRDLSPTPEIAYLRGFYDAWERCRPVENGVQHGPVGPGI